MDLFDEISAYLQSEASKEFEPVDLKQILTDLEIQTIIMSLADKRGDSGFTEDEAFAVLKWAEQAKIEQTLLELVLKGLATVDLNKDSEVTFALTERGKVVADLSNGDSES